MADHLKDPSKITAKDKVPAAENWINAYNTLKNASATPETPERLRDARNQIIDGYILLADAAYSWFEGDYNDQIAYFEIGADLVNLGLTAASAVTGPAAQLGAAATGALGVQHSIEKNGLNSQTRFVIANRMNAIRDQKRADIKRHELEPVSCGAPTVVGAGNAGSQQTGISDVCYTLEDATRDVNEYFALGTIHRALESIETETQKINQATPGTTTQQAQVALTTGDSAIFTVGREDLFTVKAAGVPTPSLSIITGTPPHDLVFTDNGNGTGTLKGVPAMGTDGSHDVTILAHNGIGSDARQKLTISVKVPQPPAITSANNATFIAGVAQTVSITTTGWPTPTLNLTGALPSGIKFTDSGNGTATLAGTAAAVTPMPLTLTITARNGEGTATIQSFQLTVQARP